MSEMTEENQVFFSKYYMVRCMIHNGTEKHVAELTAKLKQFFKEHFPKSTCELCSVDDYWKYPGAKEVIYEIADIELYGVSRFIKTLLLSWHFKATKGYEVDLEKTFYNEDAIWSRNVNPEEEFFLPEVSWVHIYTWPEEKS